MIRFIYAILVLISFSVSAEEVIRYRVKSGDSLSIILFKLNIGPIYGKKGFQKLSARKNNLKLKGDFIRVGDVLVFPAAAVNRIVASEETKNNESTETKNKEEIDQYHALGFSPTVSWLKFSSDSRDQFQHNQVSLRAKPVVGVNLHYDLHWDAHWKFQVFGSLSRINFYPDKNLKFQSHSFSRNSYGLGAGYQNGASEFGLRAGFYDEFFFTLPSTTEIRTTVVALPEVLLSFHRKLLERKKLSLKWGVSVRYIMPYSTSQIHGDSGFGAGSEFLIGSKTKALRFFTNFIQANAHKNRTETFELGIGYAFQGDFYD